MKNKKYVLVFKSYKMGMLRQLIEKVCCINKITETTSARSLTFIDISPMKSSRNVTIAAGKNEPKITKILSSLNKEQNMKKLM